MKLNTIFLVDELTNISTLFVMLKDSTCSLLDNFGQSKSDIKIYNNFFSSESINKYNLSEKMSSVNDNNFLCFWYGHGTDESFNINDEKLVTKSDNHYVFSNALVYTFSCLNGGALADVLIENKAKAFIGYKCEANCPYGLDEMTCDISMSFITSFLDGKRVVDAVNDLKEKYDDAIYNDDLDPFQRECFQKNRDGIVLKGDIDVTIEDLLIA